MDGFSHGVRFAPGDHELLYHLTKKVENPQYSNVFINETNIYETDPETLTNLYQSNGKKEWHFFSIREASKNRKGAKRTTGDGYWRASVANKAVFYDGRIVGYRKGLEYLRGIPSKGEKTPWLMHEYTLHGINDIPNTVETWSVCKIYISKRKSKVYDIDTHGELEADNGSQPPSFKQEARICNSSTHVDDPMNYPVGQLICVDEYICSESITNPTNHENQGFSMSETWDMLELAKPLNKENTVVSRTESWDMLELEKLLNEENEVVSSSESWDMLELDKLLNEENEVVSSSESWDMLDLEKLLDEI
ncbi:NAC domain-containing protein 72-like [Primulina eburnea]|uniref:NAC domain-containing protein 72-like n=1 Tax=Primulina eburnea TaxID=1245227 RepID=UPI003C6C9B10